MIQHADDKVLAIISEYVYVTAMNNPVAALTRRFGLAVFLPLAMLSWPPSLPQAAELVMFERRGCPYCARWNAEVAPAYVKTKEGQRAPLRRYDIDQGQPKDIALKTPVIYTPTFVLVEDGREAGRITGYIDNGMFWGTLTQLIGKLDVAAPPEQPR